MYLSFRHNSIVYFDPDYAENTVAFRSPMTYNFFACDIEYQGETFGSVEQAYQFTKASMLGCTEIAKRVWKRYQDSVKGTAILKCLGLSQVRYHERACKEEV